MMQLIFMPVETQRKNESIFASLYYFHSKLSFYWTLNILWYWLFSAILDQFIPNDDEFICIWYMYDTAYTRANS